jgi:hypothetical protein
MRRLALAVLGAFLLVAPLGTTAPGCEQAGGAPDAASSVDGGPFDSGPCSSDDDCPGSYCNLGSNLCCVPAMPPYEMCGDRIDQNCDGHDGSCGDNDGDRVSACMPSEDPVSGCDCDDERMDVRPAAPEICDGRDNDCNGRIDEAAGCCAGCASLGADRAVRADVCTASGECDGAGAPDIGPCPAGQTCCTGGCTDPLTDLDNCGVCGSACTESSDRCTAGACACGGGPPCDLIGVCTAGSCG